MSRNKFFNDPFSGFATVANQANFKQVWDHVLEFEADSNLSLDDPLTREQYVQMFNALNIRHISAFRKCKTNILYYIRYQIAEGDLPAEQEDVFTSITHEELHIKDKKIIYYFKSVFQLYDAIQSSIDLSTSYDRTLYDIPAAILFLAWYGLTEDQILNLLKKDVLDDGVIVDDVMIKIPFKVMQIITRLRDAEGFEQQARGVIFHKYFPSAYLFRSERNPQMTLYSLRSCVSRLNVLSNRAFSLRYDVAYFSGLFNRIYQLERKDKNFNLGDPEFVSKVFCEDLSDSTKRLYRIKDYQLYKQLFN